MRLSPRIVCKEQTHCVHRFRKACCFVYVFAVIAVGLPGAAHGARVFEEATQVIDVWAPQRTDLLKPAAAAEKSSV